jgi:uncharacterized protein YprB with RNaseH-like and TPR domain
MLRNTFCHIPSISLRTERLLWESGIVSWEHGNCLPKGIVSPARSSALKAMIPTSEDALQRLDLQFFSERLPGSELWRIFPEFRTRAVYLDIETTGLGRGDHITTIVAYDGKTLHHFVHGINLRDFTAFIGQVELLITFNGKCFDIPFIQRAFGIQVNAVHMDLRYILRSVGLRGGLKRCEQQLGLDRAELGEVDGYFAVLLWQEYAARRNERALETLLAYNTLDVINLEPLMVTAFNRLVRCTPLANPYILPTDFDLPANPFKADEALIERLQEYHFAG